MNFYDWEFDTFVKAYRTLREQYDDLAHENSSLRHQVRELEVKIEMLNRQAAGVKETAFYLQRNDGSLTATAYHLTTNGTHPVCRRAIDLSKYTRVELATPPAELCKSCAKGSSYEPVGKKRTAEWLKQIAPDANPAFTTYVYIFRARGENRFKVGKSTNVQQRMNALRHAGGAELDIEFISAPCTNIGAVNAERQVRDAYSSKRIAHEWFRFANSEILRVRQIIEEAVMDDRERHTRSAA